MSVFLAVCPYYKKGLLMCEEMKQVEYYAERMEIGKPQKHKSDFYFKTWLLYKSLPR